MKKPTIKFPCAASNKAMPGESVIEVTFPNGSGALISVQQFGDLSIIDVFQADPGVTVRASGLDVEE